MKIPAIALKNVLTARGLNVAILAERSGVSSSELVASLDGDGDLGEDEIVSIASELAVPVEALFAQQALPLFPSVDFRTATPSVRVFEKGTLEAIAFVERLSATFSALDLTPALGPGLDPVRVPLTEANAITLAAEWRHRWGISNDDQLNWKDANKVYGSLREFVEQLGILVLHRSFNTDEAAGLYVHVDDGPHVIVVNTTKSSKARKLFTLAHEFCHVLLRAEGISNPSILKNKVERFCNKFAAYLLAPSGLISQGLDRYGYTPSIEDRFVRLFAKNLGISQEALLLRLVEEKLIARDDYSRWRSKFNGVTPPGDQGDGNGGQSDPLQNKRTAYGGTLLRLLARAHRLGQLDEIDIYRLSGLKPKYQKPLFEAI